MGLPFSLVLFLYSFSRNSFTLMACGLADEGGALRLFVVVHQSSEIRNSTGGTQRKGFPRARSTQPQPAGKQSNKINKIKIVKVILMNFKKISK